MQPTSIKKWQALYPSISDSTFRIIFRKSFNTTRETRIQSFQYRLLHRTITCRKKLHEMKILASPLCTFCQEIDDIPHFFVNCCYVRAFWISLFSWLNDILSFSQTLDEKDILFGLDGDNDKIMAVNYTIIYAKYYIHKNRIKECHELNIAAFKFWLKSVLSIEKKITKETRPLQFVKFQTLYDHL